MRFKLFLESRDNLTSWLDPKGDFHPVPGNSTHMDVARSITKLSYPKCFHKLFREGWVRVNYFSDKELYAHNYLQPPNRRQLKALIDLAITNNMAYVVYDNEQDNKVLWSKDDSL